MPMATRIMASQYQHPPNSDLYLNNNIYVNGAYAPTLSDAWSLIAP